MLLLASCKPKQVTVRELYLNDSLTAIEYSMPSRSFNRMVKEQERTARVEAKQEVKIAKVDAKTERVEIRQKERSQRQENRAEVQSIKQETKQLRRHEKSLKWIFFILLLISIAFFYFKKQVRF